ncbi:MAG: hypothetical protein MI922_03155, partial [Bacteroidales bacterium]|nr:hypothetical protein [Bacteroidales bacterium]
MNKAANLMSAERRFKKMKKLFRKAVTVAGSAAMIGATVGMAAAASYPEPFTSNTSIVVGANAAPSDNIAAGEIAENLDASSDGATTVTVEGGESFDLYDSDKLHFGDSLNASISSVDDGDMTALDDGEYDDGDIDVDYEQKVTLGSQALELIVDSDLNDEEPTLGYHFDDTEVLTYSLSFKSNGAKIEHTDSSNDKDGMKGTDMPLFGKDYFVLDAEDTKITLLNSAEKVV